MWRRWLIVFVALVGALAALTALLFPSNARRVRSRFQTLATLVSVPSGEQDLARLARARRLGGMLADAVEVAFDEGASPLYGRNAVVAVAALPPAVAGAIKVELNDVTVQVSSGGSEATSAARARVTLTNPQTSQPSAEERDVSLHWRKIDGEWLVATARVGPSSQPR